MSKRLISIFLALLLIGGSAAFAAPGYQMNPGTGDILGQGKYQSDAHKIFRMVRYVQATPASDTTLPADSIVVWDLTADDGVTVTTTTTSYDSAVAGIIVQACLTQDTTLSGNTAAQDRGQRNWTWLQTYGLSQVNLEAAVGGGTITAGDAMSTSTTKGEAIIFVGSTTDARAQGKAGFFYDADTYGTDDVECFLIGLD